MKSFVLALLIAAFSIQAADVESDHRIEGTWKGTLEVLGQEMPIIFVLTELGNGQASGYMLSPQQTLEKIPLAQVSLKDREVKLYCELLKGSYAGKLSPKSGKIKGDWTQGGHTLPLDLELSDDVATIDRPQNPTGTPDYKVEEVKFINKFGPHNMAGTLTLPADVSRPVPAVVLVSGSGPQDRDETLFGHKPFWVIADYLTRKGIAVLRYDDRGVGKSGGNFEEGTHMDFSTDAWAAVAFLTLQKEIDPKKIGILGHSEGGMVGPIVATKREDVAFLVLLAGPGVRGDETILTQSKAIGEKVGLPEDFIELNQQFSRALFEALSQPIPDVERVTALGRKFEAEAKKIAGLDPTMLEGLKETMLRDLSMFEKPWFHNFIKHDPGPVLEKVSCPVLALNGELDLQVLPDVHLPEIEAHLKAGGNRNFEVHKLKGLNHLFQKAETGVPAEYGKIDETISPAVLKQVTEWISKVTGL